ncbi:hypothetical protein FACS1894111_12260 [Clostridia bacterium]|nr:hypothetical protein FACS1894111_12260 [Clostridia bacterium]
MNHEEILTYIAKGYWEQVFSTVSDGLKQNHKDHILYTMLGKYYERINVNQAYLCYENAEFYCDENRDENYATDLGLIQGLKSAIQTQDGFDLQKVSIVIVSYDMGEGDYLKECIKSIKETTPPQSYELLIVDNASTDGIAEWLKEQSDIKLICNGENKGFPYACNQGIKSAAGENDILLLHHDTVVLPNTIFYLRMGLYERENVGATGSVTNGGQLTQGIGEQYQSTEESLRFAKTNNVPMKQPYEKKVFLNDFALLLKRTALDAIGLFDIRFTPGTCEDWDIALRLHMAGYQLLLCHNSFLIHFCKEDGLNFVVGNEALDKNIQKLKDKWGFALNYYASPRNDLIAMMQHKKEEAISLLEIGCGAGGTLAKLEHLFPNASVCGIELTESLAKIGANQLNIIQGNIETMTLPYEQNSFDYILFGDVLEHLYQPEDTIKRLLPYLKDTGVYLCSIPNIMHFSVLNPLLAGEFEYQDEGILDRTHLRFFTQNSIRNMFERCQMDITRFCGRIGTGVFDLGLEQLPAEKQWEVYQYLVCVGKRSHKR